MTALPATSSASAAPAGVAPIPTSDADASSGAGSVGTIPPATASAVAARVDPRTTPVGGLDPRTTPAGGIDPRGPRFGAAITTVVLSVALVLASPVLLALQAVVFALGALAGPARQPYGLLFKRFVRPRLAAPTHLEHPGAPRFAQSCGLAFSLVGLLGFALGWQWLALGAIGLALGAAFLNAAFDFCVGCEVYLRAQRLRRT